MSGWSLLLCLLMAGGLGAAISWVLKSLFFSEQKKEYQNRLTDLENSWAARWQAKTNEYDALQMNYEAQAAHLSALDKDFALATISLKEHKAALTEWEARYQKLATTGSAEPTKEAAEVAELKTQLSTVQDKLSSQIKACVMHNAELAKFRSAISDWEDRYKRLEAVSSAKNTRDDNQIAELKSQVARLQSELNVRTKAASITDAELLTLRKNLAAKDAELTRLMSSVTAVEVLQAQVGAAEAKYQSVLTSREAEIGKLRAQITELELMTNHKRTPDWTDLVLLDGIGETHYQKLAAAGIARQKDLLLRGANKKGRQEIAARAGLPEEQILMWVNHCDLRRVNGISEQYAKLLERAGVDTVTELAARRPDNLHHKLLEVNNEKQIAPQTPMAEEVIAWVAQAKILERVVTH